MKDTTEVKVCQFREDEARAYGLHGALFLNRLRFWVLRNRATGANYRNGRTWSYTSARQIAPLIFTTEATTRRVIRRLVEAGVILTERRVIGGAEQPLSYAFVDEARLIGPAKPTPGGSVIGMEERRQRLVGQQGEALQNGGGAVQFAQTPVQSEQLLRYSDRYSNSYLTTTAASADADGSPLPSVVEAEALQRCVGGDYQPQQVEAEIGASANPVPCSVAEVKTQNTVTVAPVAGAAPSAEREAAVKRHAAAAAIAGVGAKGRRARTADDGEAAPQRPARGGGAKARKPRFLPPTPLFLHYLGAMKTAGYAAVQIMRTADAESLEVILGACGGDEAAARRYIDHCVLDWRGARGRHGIQAPVPTPHLLTSGWMDLLFAEVFKPSDVAPGAPPREENAIEKAVREANERKAKRDAAAANARSQGET